MKNLDDAIAVANDNGTIDGKALAIKVSLMVAATAASIAAVAYGQKLIEKAAKDPE